MGELKPLIVIVGPTAIGKTEQAIRIAKRLDGEIVSADSMQIYKYMNIGSAKPTKDEMQDIPHYMIDEIEPDEDFSVACFQEKALKYIEQIHARIKLPILVGGTGLYVNSIVYPMNFTQAQGDWHYRDRLNRMAEEEGTEVLYKQMERIDPKSAVRIHPNDRKRIIRALEVYHLTGKAMSEYEQNYRQQQVPFHLIMLGMKMDRTLLYARIDQRVDLMIKKGLLHEVEDLISRGYDRYLPSLQGLGYKELVAFLKSECTLEEAVDIIKRDTRRFAKRQLTWFKRDKRIEWFDVTQYSNPEELTHEMISYIEEKIL